MTVKDYNSSQSVYVASTVVNSDDNKRLDNEEQEIAYTPWEANAPPAEAIPAPHVSSTTSTNIPHVYAEAIKSSQGEMANSTSTSNPPGNCRDGGQWGILQYVGNKTGALTCIGCLLCGIFGLFVLACPQDEKDAYSVDGKLYDAQGIYIGKAAGNNAKLFIPTVRRPEPRKQ